MPMLIGTSGWQYRDWRGGLYPEGVPQRLWLEHYATHYLTVENNSSFYRLPSKETFAAWRERTPDDFVMAVKASRYLTHVRRLRDPAEPVARLLGAAAGLGPKLGPVLLQLPPTLKADPDTLDACLKEFRTAAAALGEHGLRLAVEPRHETWWTNEIRQILAAHDATLCWADRRGRPITPLWRTATWGYLRFHEGTAQPWPSYGPQALRSWVARLTEAWPDEADVYVYFNNDPGGAAVVNSAEFADLARQAGKQRDPHARGRPGGRDRGHPDLVRIRTAELRSGAGSPAPPAGHRAGPPGKGDDVALLGREHDDRGVS